MPRTDPTPPHEHIIREAVRRATNTAVPARVSGAGASGGGAYVTPFESETKAHEIDDAVWDDHVFILGEDAVGNPTACLGRVIE